MPHWTSAFTPGWRNRISKAAAATPGERRCLGYAARLIVAWISELGTAGEDVGMIIAHPAAENLGAKPRLASDGAQAPSRPRRRIDRQHNHWILTCETRSRVASGGNLGRTARKVRTTPGAERNPSSRDPGHRSVPEQLPIKATTEMGR